ncbi:MAG: hypothetical protein PWP15_1464 [Methanothermococcus sp.]|uniref:DUF362 domain-containing protein n=1 Tax=Methanothermococcus TaxID=155862 RepID=UPI0003719105|nr:MULTISPECIES: DUF362 domain-containing protein [Methanothermococcus]MDK2790955.1 hypothetical protein [Methanothermococcus sp.]MDK2978347.1 hypothetical protein [Bacteroidales bacterium]MDK2987930.1 hypothetical protein [Methanothermococcus sp.]
MEKVYYSTKNDYEELDNKILDLIFNEVDFDNCDKILVKPNILGPYPADRCVTTHWKFLDWVLKYLKNNFDGKIIVGESSGFSTKKSFTVSGLENVCRRHEIPYIAFESDEYIIEKICNHEIRIPKTVQECELIVNLPKLKTHMLMKYTGAVKNLYGCIPGGLKPKLHKYFPKESDFADLLVELYNKITENKNIVTIMDGIWGLEGNGPSNGRPINSRIVIGSKSPIALDMFASYYIGYKMDDILTNKYLKTDFKVINADDNKEVPLESIERMNFKKPDTVVLNSIIPFLPFVSTKLTKMIFSFMIPKPRINKRSCVKCGICEKICPVNAIHNLKIDLKKCIKCYCCHEMCRYNAVKLVRGLF